MTADAGYVIGPPRDWACWPTPPVRRLPSSRPPSFWSFSAPSLPSRLRKNGAALFLIRRAHDRVHAALDQHRRGLRRGQEPDQRLRRLGLLRPRRHARRKQRDLLYLRGQFAPTISMPSTGISSLICWKPILGVAMGDDLADRRRREFSCALSFIWSEMPSFSNISLPTYTPLALSE